MNKMIVTIGVSGSGKSSWCKEFMKENRNYVRVNRDDLRRQTNGEPALGKYYSDPVKVEFEKHITILLNEQIRHLLQNGYDVIVDNTHLRKKYLDEIKQNFNHMAEISFKFFHITAEEAKERVSKRDNVDTAYITGQYQDYLKLLDKCGGDFTLPQIKYHTYDFLQIKEAKGKCYLVDIDGTVADCSGVRSPYDGDKLHLDRPIDSVRNVLQSLSGNWFTRWIGVSPEIIYVSGREDKWKNATIKWLKDNKFPFDGKMYMRKTGDFRDDAIVKEEIYENHIADNYAVLGVFDDRLKVLHNAWFKRKLFVFNVNQGLKYF